MSLDSVSSLFKQNKVAISDLGLGHIQGSKILLRSNFLFLRKWLRLVSDWLNFRALGSQNLSLSTKVSDHFPGWRNQMFGGSVMHPLFELEGQGVPTKQAQAISAGITEVLEEVQESLMERTEMIQESSESKIKAEVQRSQLATGHFCAITLAASPRRSLSSGTASFSSPLLRLRVCFHSRHYMLTYLSLLF
ncbi:uncharacterized protein [Arachis hypogaea]|uniref:uncharacterized protein isoform X2 n=1 Tax=Arachis hypogaea TaxID=3818 RepID=UPI000DEC3C16|nr:uncharacterized protein LOC112800852 isoform X3 [Arachis hypogaea]